MKHLTLTYSCRSVIDKNQAKPATTVKTQKNISSGEKIRENIRPNLGLIELCNIMLSL